MEKVYFIILMLTLALGTNAQHQDFLESSKMWKDGEKAPTSTGNLLKAFKNGTANGHFRYFFMHTDNAHGLMDFYANAVGGGLRYETADFHGFKLRFSGFYVYNIGSSDFTQKDSIVNRGSRYELALFDIENPRNRSDVDRLEELQIEYNLGKSTFKFGKMLINTPFINSQDSRMMPTIARGFWFNIEELTHLKIQGGWLGGISPRGTARWFSMGQSLGLYPVGVDERGLPSGYTGNISSSGIFILGVGARIHSDFKAKLWSYYFENVFHTGLLQIEYTRNVAAKASLESGFQFVRQDALNDGGNPDPQLAYIKKGSTAITFGLKAGINFNTFKISLNYNRITGRSRFLMPREWGREPFFTFLSRERNEGMGDVHAFMLKLDYHSPNKPMKIYLGIGYYDTPDVLNYRLNKYGIPDYTQLDFDLNYDFDRMLDGLDLHLLYVFKMNQGDLHDDRRFEFNRVNMHQYNVVLNYHF